MVRIALFLRPHLIPGDDPAGIVDAARLADAAGLHSIHFGEHLVMGKRTDRYYAGPFRHGPETPWLDPLTTMAAIAAVTSRIRLSAGVVLAPLRPAVVLAKTIATLDVLSHGRVELGIGTGWQREEYDAVGYDWATRFARFDETIRVCRLLWTGEPVTYKGQDFSLDDVVALPRPVQERVPLLYGMNATPAHARRIAALGDGWDPRRLTPAECREGVERIAEQYVMAGRDPSTLLVRMSLPNIQRSDGRLDLERMFALVPDLLVAGVNVIGVGPNHELLGDELEELLAELATARTWF